MKLPPEDRFPRQALQTHILDSDSEWWPFAFLRPEQHQDFTTTRCVVLALLYGTPTSLSGIVAGQLLGDQMQGLQLVLFPLGVTLLLFAAFQIGVASYWNRRAARLRPQHERRTQWQRSLGDRSLGD